MITENNNVTLPLSALRDAWPDLPRASRRNYLGAVASSLHDLWRHQADLSDIVLENFSFRTDLGPVTAQLQSVHIRRLDRPMTQARILDVLADWQEHLRTVLSPRDRLIFLRAFLWEEAVDRATLLFAVRRVAKLSTDRALSRARAAYVRHLSPHLNALWGPDPGLSAASLKQALEEAERREGTQVVKSGPSIRVLHAKLLEQDVLIKRYDLVSAMDKIKYSFRASRARRAWAAANTLRDMGIPTPEPLGFLDVEAGKAVVTSYVITRFLPDATSTYRWLKLNYRRQTDSWKRAFRFDLLKVFLSLYRAGLYHADTKLPNLLVRSAGYRAHREFFWIDLECVAAGRKPTRRQVIRNLVQMNGSMRYWVPESERLEFLHELAQYIPWVAHPDVIQKIRHWTKRRLKREVRRHTAPDGLLSRK